MAETEDLIERGKRAIARLNKATEEYRQTLRRLGYAVPVRRAENQAKRRPKHPK